MTKWMAAWLLDDNQLLSKTVTSPCPPPPPPIRPLVKGCPVYFLLTVFKMCEWVVSQEEKVYRVANNNHR